MTTSSSPPSPPSAAPEQLEHLRSLCGGAVHLPGDPLYDEARVPWNLHVDARPAAVAYPAFPDEVAAVLRGAAAAGLKVAPQGTGHGAPPLAGRLGDAVLLRTSAMTELAIDAERRTARVGAGVLWGDVIHRAWEAGLAARHMSSPTVGVVGSSLGGGISWYGRAHGLQSSALTAVEVVLADGTFVRATEDSDSELLWAARGGGGGFGVVTAVEFDLLPVTGACAGMMVWDWKDARRVLGAWAEWAVEAPDAVTSVAPAPGPGPGLAARGHSRAAGRRHRRGGAGRRAPGGGPAGPAAEPAARPRHLPAGGPNGPRQHAPRPRGADRGLRQQRPA